MGQSSSGKGRCIGQSSSGTGRSISQSSGGKGCCVGQSFSIKGCCIGESSSAALPVNRCSKDLCTSLQSSQSSHDVHSILSGCSASDQLCSKARGCHSFEIAVAPGACAATT